jgi:hypothetical protein
LRARTRAPRLDRNRRAVTPGGVEWRTRRA